MQRTGKGKEGKVSPNHDVKAYMDSRGIVPLILNLGPNSFTPGKEPRFPSTSRLDGPQGRSGGFEHDRNLFSLPGFKHRTVQPVA